jgi:hypothetical protein
LASASRLDAAHLARFFEVAPGCSELQVRTCCRRCSPPSRRPHSAASAAQPWPREAEARRPARGSTGCRALHREPPTPRAARTPARAEGRASQPVRRAQQFLELRTGSGATAFTGPRRRGRAGRGSARRVGDVDPREPLPAVAERCRGRAGTAWPSGSAPPSRASTTPSRSETRRTPAASTRAASSSQAVQTSARKPSPGAALSSSSASPREP